MTREDLVRKLRALKRLEQRLSASPDAPIWNECFSVKEGKRVRYPFAVLLAFDRASRERVFQEYLMALWARGRGIRVDAPSRDERLRSLLGVASDASADEVRSAFRRRALEVHPDLGGEEELMRELIELYRESR